MRAKGERERERKKHREHCSDGEQSTILKDAFNLREMVSNSKEAIALALTLLLSSTHKKTNNKIVVPLVNYNGRVVSLGETFVKSRRVSIKIDEVK